MSSGVPLLNSVHNLRAVAEPTRLRLVSLLARGELAVSEIGQVLGQSQPRVSRHLKVLLDAGFVERFPEGGWVFYRLAEPDDGSESAHLAKVLIDGLDATDPVIAGDLDRLEEVKTARATEVATYFETHAREWIRLRALYQPVIEVETAMRELLGPERVDFLVDLGTGTGRVLEALSGLYRHAVGFDTNHAMLSVARVNLDRSRIRHAHVRQGNILSLPHSREEADAVVIHQVLHYLDNPVAAIASAARLLAPGGRLLIVDFAPHDLEFLRADHAHRRLGFSDPEILEWCRSSGLEACETRRVVPGSKLPEDDRKLPTVSLWLAKRPAEGRSIRMERVG